MHIEHNIASLRRAEEESTISGSLAFDNNISGCCAIPNVLPEDFVSTSLEGARSNLDYLGLELQKRRSEALESNQEHLLARQLEQIFVNLLTGMGVEEMLSFSLIDFHSLLQVLYTTQLYIHL